VPDIEYVLHMKTRSCIMSESETTQVVKLKSYKGRRSWMAKRTLA